MPATDLARGSEVFLAGTAAEVTQVVCIGEQRHTPGDIPRTLMEDYNALVRMPPAEMAKIVA